MPDEPISPESLISNLCFLKCGGTSEEHGEQLRDDLLRFRLTTKEYLPLTRQAINHWFKVGGLPSRSDAIAFLDAYFSRNIILSSLASEEQHRVYDRLAKYFLENRSRKMSSGHTLMSSIYKFFGVRPQDVTSSRSISGSYSIFFRAETVKDHVVCGAIRLSSSDVGKAFEAAERQIIKLNGAVEEWTGFYFVKSESIVVILRGSGGVLDGSPKFYIFSQQRFDSKKHLVEATGVMLKTGSGSVFHAKTLLRRDDDAVSKCDVIPNACVSEDILRVL